MNFIIGKIDIPRRLDVSMREIKGVEKFCNASKKKIP